MSGYADIIRAHQAADYGTHIEDYDDDRPTWAEAQADEQEGYYATPGPLPCPDCGTTEDQCLPPGCCDPCQARAHDCPATRHDMFGLHQRGLCGCGR